jgi:hypothetical protein
MAEPDAPEDEDACTTIQVEEIADTVETAIRQPGKIIAFPRYELRHIPLIGPEAFFLRLAFLQERFLNTPANGRTRPFETTVEALLRWANVGRATLHRFKKGDPARGQMPAAGWLGIEQLPAAPRSSDAPQQPPCRYRIQQGIPLTPMDADRLLGLLQDAGVRSDPLAAIQSLLDRPQHDLLVFPPPAPSDEIRRRAPFFLSVPGLVQKALEGVKLEGDLRARVQEAAARLNDHITQPQQMVFVSWYFLQEWLPILGHDAAALILYLRAQGYYNPQEHELRDQVTIAGGFAELAQVIGLKRDRTIADWLPNLFERQENRPASAPDSQKWQREQQRLQKTQQRIAQFVQVQPGSRKKSASGFYSFDLHVEITAEPLTPLDQGVCAWLYRTLAACEQQGVLAHFHAWVTSPAMERMAKEEEETQDLASQQNKEDLGQNDGAGILYPPQNDGWGILAARAEAGQTPGRESWVLEDDGWGILRSILNDGRGILARFEMTARELFKRLLRLNSYWDSILLQITTQPNAPATAKAVLVGEAWDLKRLFEQNGGISGLRQKALRQERSPKPFLSWLFYAYSFKGRGIQDPFGWALKKVIESPGQEAGSVFSDLAARRPGDLARLVRRQIESGQAPGDPAWQYAFQDATPLQLRRLIETLGLAG